MGSPGWCEPSRARLGRWTGKRDRSRMPEAKEQHIEGTKSLDRALTVLLAIAERGEQGMTLSDCASVLGYSKATTHRILQTLARREFLRLDEARGTFTLGVTNL